MFGRFFLVLCFGRLLLAPTLFVAYQPLAEVVRDIVLPQLPDNGRLSDVPLLVIEIVGMTVAAWQSFFQQSYLIER